MSQTTLLAKGGGCQENALNFYLQELAKPRYVALETIQKRQSNQNPRTLWEKEVKNQDDCY